MTERYTKAGETIRDNYTERHYPLDEVPFLLCLPFPSSEVLRGTRCPSLSVEIKSKEQRMCNTVWLGAVPALS